MDLNKLFSFMSDKGFGYISGSCHKGNEYIRFEFSTGHNGRGDAIEVEIKTDSTQNNIECWIQQGEHIKKENIAESELYPFIDNFLKLNQK